MSVTVHLVFNAHLDPVWLWPWQAGLDEALATCRSACDRLDAHPELVFTRGEGWVYEQIERCDPALFERVREHVRSGRWEIVGGWWIQPDCNGPSSWAMDWQVELGAKYFQSRFGVFPRVAYNVDSFGHSAHLPALMRRHGQDRYVMMRPQEHEMALPARLFRWRGVNDGPEVVVFRIARAYAAREITEEHLLASLRELPAGCGHTMCFVGVGDHGGGPTERQIEWCLEHRDAIPGCHLEFSCPNRFFEAVERERLELPLVVGELQQHAIGCYSVYRPIKTAVRRAEHSIRQAEIADPSVDLGLAKERVCFAHFHDVFGGTCLSSASPQILDRLGGAAADADEALHVAVRRALNEQPRDMHQRIVAFNASDSPHCGYATHDPWLDGQRWDSSWRLLDEDGRPVEIQRVRSDGAVDDDDLGLLRILFRAEVPAAGTRVWRLVRDEGQSASESTALPNIPTVRFELYDDPSDTWSHGMDRYSEEPVAVAGLGTSEVIASGPLMSSICETTQVGDSLLWAVWRSYAGEPFVELELTVDWREQNRLLKMVLRPRAPWMKRRDGIMGGSLARALDGRELPLRDWTLLDDNGVVCPDVFALDVTSERARFTLLRSPQMAHHAPHSGFVHQPIAYSDRGVHRFRFRFFRSSDEATLERHAMMLQRPLVFADLTRGM